MNPSALLSTHVLLDAELEPSILDHVDAVVIVSWPEQTFTLLQLDAHHVATQLKEQGLLKMTQDPTTSCRTHMRKRKGRSHSTD